MVIDSIDITIPFSKRHTNETVRTILRYDSGYIKDLFIKNENIVFTNEVFEELKRLTLGHRDNWESPAIPSKNIFRDLKSYRTPYLFDFNDELIIDIHKERQKRLLG